MWAAEDSSNMGFSFFQVSIDLTDAGNGRL